jgi:hypothetical protein
MSEDPTSVTRLDLEALTDWLCSGAAGSAGWSGEDWYTVLDLMSTELYGAAADGHGRDWRRISQGYLMALDNAAPVWSGRPEEPAILQLNLIEVLTRTVPPDPAAELLSPGRAAALFFGTVPVDLDEASRLAGQDRRSISVDDLVGLRRTALMLRPMARLTPRLSAEAVERLRPWLALLPRLP